MNLPDIDIDTRTDFDGGTIPYSTRASRVLNSELLYHNSGYYFENIPVDDISNLSAIPYKKANDMGYFKVDILHNSVYDIFNSHDEIKEILAIQPDWTILKSSKNIRKLTQIHNHENIVRTIKPTHINDLADVLALIRPAKKHLLIPYATGRIQRSELYTKGQGFHYKKSHAVAYAHVIVIQMQLLKFNLL